MAGTCATPANAAARPSPNITGKRREYDGKNPCGPNNKHDRFAGKVISWRIFQTRAWRRSASRKPQNVQPQNAQRAQNRISSGHALRSPNFNKEKTRCSCQQVGYPETAKKGLLILTVWWKNDPMNVHHVLIWLIRFPIQTVILFALVWIMVKIQKLDQNSEFHFLKLLGVVALASVLETLPFVGIELSGVALWMGIKYVTRSPVVDALFNRLHFLRAHVCCEPVHFGSLHGDLRHPPDMLKPRAIGARSPDTNRRNGT